MKPTNVTRLLDQRNIPYQAFELPAKKIGALEAAQLLNVDPEMVYKTIVVTQISKGKPILALVPGPMEVDLKAVARAVGEKKVTLPTEREAEKITNLKAGGISPLALLNRGFQVLIDAAARDLPELYISGGKRGLDIRLPVMALRELTGAVIVEIAKKR